MLRLCAQRPESCQLQLNCGLSTISATSTRARVSTSQLFTENNDKQNRAGVDGKACLDFCSPACCHLPILLWSQIHSTLHASAGDTDIQTLSSLEGARLATFDT